MFMPIYFKNPRTEFYAASPNKIRPQTILKTTPQDARKYFLTKNIYLSQTQKKLGEPYTLFL